MKSNLLCKFDDFELLSRTERTYGDEEIKRCRDRFIELCKEGVIVKGTFDSHKWMTFSGIKQFGIDFSFDSELYKNHFAYKYGISQESFLSMLKCYAISCIGVYINATVARGIVNKIKEFVTRNGDDDFSLNMDVEGIIVGFLEYIGFTEEQVYEALSLVRVMKDKPAERRKLAPVVTYLAIEKEIDRLYQSDIDDQLFIRWFPIYFWVKISLIIPLRPTEILCTPYKCIERRGNDVYLVVRRTQLKKRNSRPFSKVEKDYKVFRYPFPDDERVHVIEKYVQMTASLKRRFLFSFSAACIHEMVSLKVYNQLLKEFIEEYLFENHTYDFARYAMGRKEFPLVTIGDSRPIAIANLKIQGVSEDIIRQLADHENIDASAHYFSNVDEIILGSAIMKAQRHTQLYGTQMGDQKMMGEQMLIDGDKPYCTSLGRIVDESNVEDCIRERHIEHCMGCDYYRPTEKAVNRFYESEKKRLRETAKRYQEFLNSVAQMKNGSEWDRCKLSLETTMVRYATACRIKMEEEKKKWQRHRDTQKDFF